MRQPCDPREPEYTPGDWVTPKTDIIFTAPAKDLREVIGMIITFIGVVFLLLAFFEWVVNG